MFVNIYINMYLQDDSQSSHDYEIEHYNLRVHSSLTLIVLYSHKMNFDVLRAWN